MAELTAVDFISFKKIYPRFLYPGGDLADDHTFPPISGNGLSVSRQLTWYNPFSWITRGLFAKGQLVHAQWWSLPLVFIFLCVCGGFKLRKKPVVFTVHNVLDHEGSRWFQRLSKLLFKLGDHFIVHSKKNKVQMVQTYGIPEERITRIPHGLLDFPRAQAADPDVFRKKLGLDPSDKVILLFGAIRPYKGIDTAISALSRVVTKIPSARLLIAGKPWEKWDRYEGLIQERRLAPFVKTHLAYVPTEMVAGFFGASDLVLLPYRRFDSQSGVGAAAVAFRKPMIVSAVGGLPDLVAEESQVVPPGDPDALANAIIESLGSAERLSAMSGAAEHVAETLSWSAVADQTMAVYRTALNL